jgi:hypothetical protein
MEEYRIYKEVRGSYEYIETCDQKKADEVYRTSSGHILAIKHNIELKQDEPYFNVYNPKFSINTAEIKNGQVQNAQNINIDMQDCIEIKAYDTQKNHEEER